MLVPKIKVARPSFTIGMARAFDLGGTMPSRTVKLIPRLPDKLYVIKMRKRDTEKIRMDFSNSLKELLQNG